MGVDFSGLGPHPVRMPLLSAKDYAAHRGVTAQAVSKAIKSGRLKDSLKPDPGGGKKPKLDVELADQEWQKNSDQSKARGAAAEAAQIFQEKKIGTGGFALPVGENPAPHEGPMPLDYAGARARRERAQAQLAELELAVKEGLLVPADAVQKQWVDAATIARTKVLGIPSKARQLMELTPAQYAVLEQVTYQALEDISLAGTEKEKEMEAVNA